MGVWVKPGQKRNVAVGRISIPAIDVDAPYRLGAHDDIVRLGPGLWPATPLPGEAGNAVFAGHRTTYTHPFRDLDFLNEGDRIRTTIQGRPPTVFKVLRTPIVPEAEYADFVLDPPERPGVRMVTLFACTPKGILGVEERHAAIVAQLLGREPEGGVYVGAVNKPADKTTVLGAIKPYFAGAKAAATVAAVTP